MKISEELVNSKFGKGLSGCGNENFNSYFTNGGKEANNFNDFTEVMNQVTCRMKIRSQGELDMKWYFNSLGIS